MCTGNVIDVFVPFCYRIHRFAKQSKLLATLKNYICVYRILQTLKNTAFPQDQGYAILYAIYVSLDAPLRV